MMMKLTFEWNKSHTHESIDSVYREICDVRG